MIELKRKALVHTGKLLTIGKLKSTPQRAIILSYLKNSTAHPTAEMIYKDVKKEYPSLSINTVYQTLKIFEKKQMIFAIATHNGIKRYDAHTKPHIHLICLKCGKIIDVPYDDRRVAAKIKAKFVPEKSVFTIYGRCLENCQS